MSADNGIVIQKYGGGYKVKYYQGDGCADCWRVKTLEEAVKKAKELQDEYEPEYGIALKI